MATVVPEKASIAAVLWVCREDTRTGQSSEEGCDQGSTRKSEVTAIPQANPLLSPAGLGLSPHVRHLGRKRCSDELMGTKNEFTSKTTVIRGGRQVGLDLFLPFLFPHRQGHAGLSSYSSFHGNGPTWTPLFVQLQGCLYIVCV